MGDSSFGMRTTSQGERSDTREHHCEENNGHRAVTLIDLLFSSYGAHQ